MPDAREGIRFLRAACRLARRLPSEVIRRKFRFNAREAVEFYSHVKDTSLVSDRLRRGWEFLGTVEKMLGCSDALVKEVFKPFDFMESTERSSEGKAKIIGPLRPQNDEDVERASSAPSQRL